MHRVIADGSGGGQTRIASAAVCEVEQPQFNDCIGPSEVAYTARDTSGGRHFFFRILGEFYSLSSVKLAIPRRASAHQPWHDPAVMISLPLSRKRQTEAHGGFLLSGCRRALIVKQGRGDRAEAAGVVVAAGAFSVGLARRNQLAEVVQHEVRISLGIVGQSVKTTHDKALP